MRIKHHINLALPTDNSMQKKAWNILTDYPPVSRTSAICHALCEYRQQWAFLRAIQQLLDDTLSHIVYAGSVGVTIRRVRLEQQRI